MPRRCWYSWGSSGLRRRTSAERFDTSHGAAIFPHSRAYCGDPAYAGHPVLGQPCPAGALDSLLAERIREALTRAPIERLETYAGVTEVAGGVGARPRR